MKCPKCGQEIIDNKEYCPNCGIKLRESSVGISMKTLLIIGAFLILLGTGITLSIMFLGTDKELEKYIDKDKPKEEEENKIIESEVKIDSYYGNYVISDVITNKNTPLEITDYKGNLLGWTVELNDKILKFGLYGIEWIIIDNPSVYTVKETNSYKTLLDTTSNIDVISVEGTNSIIPDSKEKVSVVFIKTSNRLYAYYKNTLFELKKPSYSYKENRNFYNLNLLEEDYTEEINNKIKSINNNIKNIIETNENTIIYTDYQIIEDNNIKHILVTISGGYPYSSMSTTLNTISYNKSTLKMYNLKDYLNYIGKSYEDIVTEYNNKLNLKEVDKRIDISENSMYYTKDGALYIACGTSYNSLLGYEFIEIKL